MTIRVDSSWISGAIVVGDSGFGVLASEVPTTGTNGGGYLVNDIAHYSVAPTSEVAGRIISFPAAGVFKADENSSFEHTGAPQGVYTTTYQFYVDGVATGSPATITTEFVDDRNLVVGGNLPKLSSALSLDMDVSSFNITIAGSLPKLSSSITLTRSVPAYNLSVASNLPKLSSSLVLGAAVAQYNLTVAGNLPKLSSSMVLDSEVPAYSLVIGGNLPKLSSAVALTSISTSSSNIVINGAFPKLTSTVSITRTIPSYNTTIASSLPKLNSVMAINSEGLYYFIPEGNMVFINLATNYVNIP